MNLENNDKVFNQFIYELLNNLRPTYPDKKIFNLKQYQYITTKKDIALLIDYLMILKNENIIDCNSQIHSGYVGASLTQKGMTYLESITETVEKTVKPKKAEEIKKEKRASIAKQYYQNNKVEIAEKAKIYQQENKEKLAEYQQQYYQDNKEKVAEYNKDYQQKNKEKLSEYGKKYREEHRRVSHN